MTTTKLTNLGVSAARNIYKSIVTPDMNTTLYLAVSHIEPWANDSSPIVPNDNIDDIVGFWWGMFAGKKITGNDVSLMAPRYNWVANTTYIAYIDNANPSLFTLPFYVLTSDFRVYKCLANNNSQPSTVMPTYTNTDRVNTESDGYTWKYMLTLNTNDRTRFLTSNYIPVRTLTQDDGSLQWKVQQAAVDGINIINMNNNGSGYTNTSNILVTIAGDGVSATATPSINLTSQTVSNITVTNPGSGFHWANVIISGGGGANANAQVVIPPFGGHGSNPIDELGASTLLINIRLKADENGTISVQPNYREVGIVENPVIFGTSNTILSNTVFNQTTQIVVAAGFGDFVLDEIVFQGTTVATSTFSGKVVSWDTTNNRIALTETAGTISSDILNGQTSGIARFVISSFTPDVKRYSGRVLFMDNITPVQRAADQTDDIKIFINC